MKYFVSYNFKTEDGYGWGSCDVDRKEKIKNGEDIILIGDAIKEQHGYVGVVILYWRLFEE